MNPENNPKDTMKTETRVKAKCSTVTSVPILKSSELISRIKNQS